MKYAIYWTKDEIGNIIDPPLKSIFFASYLNEYYQYLHYNLWKGYVAENKEKESNQ